jgi:hypothetical protein
LKFVDVGFDNWAQKYIYALKNLKYGLFYLYNSLALNTLQLNCSLQNITENITENKKLSNNISKVSQNKINIYQKQDMKEDDYVKYIEKSAFNPTTASMNILFLNHESVVRKEPLIPGNPKINTCEHSMNQQINVLKSQFHPFVYKNYDQNILFYFK